MHFTEIHNKIYIIIQKRYMQMNKKDFMLKMLHAFAKYSFNRNVMKLKRLYLLLS